MKSTYQIILTDRAGRTALYDENTNRSPIVERTAFEKYRFVVKPKEAI